MKRNRNTKIIATLGPSSRTPDVIEALSVAGADVFRLNFSHGTHEDHQKVRDIIRDVERKSERPVAIIADLQGPKLRIGQFANGSTRLNAGDLFHVDLDQQPGDEVRAPLPHPEIFAAIKPDDELLVDDGKMRFRVESCDDRSAKLVALTSGTVSNNKGVNIPGVVLPIAALTEKDRRDLAFALELGVDWVAQSFVQRPDDVLELRSLVGGRAGCIVKLEKPSAVSELDEIIAATDAVMVARGDLGVELPAEDVPVLQKLIVQKCRAAGKPVIVATQMLESMISSPTPTRAEASDVATAVYDGVDAVMLSAESAAGDYPLEAVTMMDRIIKRVEGAKNYRTLMNANAVELVDTSPDAIAACAALAAESLSSATAIATYTSSGSTALRVARGRPSVPILGLSPVHETARRMVLVWGLHCVWAEDAVSVRQMVENACRVSLREGFTQPNDHLIVTAGMPFGEPGKTNLMRIARVPE